MSLLAASAPALAAGSTLIALSPAQIEAAKEDGARRNAAAAAMGMGPVRDGAVHGEMGVTIGTGGYSALYGTAVAPIGESGFVALSVATERFGQQRRYVRR